MKRLIFLIALTIIPQFLIYSQPCLPDGIIFSSQSEIDEFQSNFPNCTTIEGSIIIGSIYGSNINNLNGLISLTTIEGELRIIYTEALTNLTGLNNLISLLELHVDGNNSLINLIGLGPISSLASISITGNPSLINLSGLESLTTVTNDLYIQSNSNLNSLLALSSLTYVGGNSLGGGIHLNSHPNLTDLSGLENLTSIGGCLAISFSYLLPDLSGLSGLTSIGSFLYLANNTMLTDLTGLDSLTSIGDFIWFIENPELAYLNGLNSLNYIGGDLKLENNNNLVGLTSLSSVSYVGGAIKIFNNENLSSLAGLDNIDANSIEELYIFQNNSLSFCSAQSICDYLASPSGSVNIYNNAIGCNHPFEVANTCGFNLPCLPYGNYQLRHQTDIDSFQTNYPGCFDLGGDVGIKGNDITNLIGLNVINSIDRDLIILDNPILESLSGLDNVTSVNRFIKIINNDSLSNLSGIDNIESESFDRLIIKDNNLLSTCEVESVCGFVANPNGLLQINNNASGCMSISQVSLACEALSVSNVIFYPTVKVFPNPTSKELNIFCQNNYQIKEVNIYNQLGELVLFDNMFVNTIDVSSLRKGMYIVEIVFEYYDSIIREIFLIR